MQENTSNKYATILVAEDEEYNFMFIEELLAPFKLNILHAKNGKESIDMIFANPQINLVLMDIKMPIMDGQTAALHIRKHSPHIPIIAQTAYALEHEKERYISTFDDYITKPINEGSFLSCLSKFIDLV